MAQAKQRKGMDKKQKTVKVLLRDSGQTFAAEAGIKLKNTPAPLFQLLVLALMLSARIASKKAVSATSALFEAGLNTPEKMASASWQERVDAITWSGYKRYDERTASLLGEAANKLLNDYGGDLRKLRKLADGDAPLLRRKLAEFAGIGPLGADIFLREVQSLWPEFYPYADKKVTGAARELKLSGSSDELCQLCSREDFAKLTAAIIRVKLAKKQDKLLAQVA